MVEYIRKDRGLLRTEASIGTRKESRSSHFVHMAGHDFMIDWQALALQLGRDFVIAIIRMRRIEFANAMFERHFSGGFLIGELAPQLCR
jgi:hypothetical protein